MCGCYALPLECRVLHNATLRLSRSVREPHRGKPASMFPLRYLHGGAPGPGFRGENGKRSVMRGTKAKPNRTKEGPLGKPSGREELGKRQGEAEPGGQGGADGLAVPDYVMRDFGSSEKEDRDNGTRT